MAAVADGAGGEALDDAVVELAGDAVRGVLDGVAVGAVGGDADDGLAGAVIEL